jgi:hypothetical protein
MLSRLLERNRISSISLITLEESLYLAAELCSVMGDDSCLKHGFKLWAELGRGLILLWHSIVTKLGSSSDLDVLTGCGQLVS